jgi:hypothetical protein
VIRVVLVLLALCAALAAGAAVLGPRGPAPAEPALVRLAADLALERRTVAAVSVEVRGRDVRWLFARSKGRWRAREAFGAFLDEHAFQAWLADLLDARGLVVSDDPARAAEYGLAPELLVRVGLHGPRVLDAENRDELAVFELGRGPDGRTFGRRAGSAETCELDRALLEPLGALEPGSLPRFVDTHLLAGSLEPGVLGFRRIAIERRDGPRIELARDAAEDGSAAWRVASDGAESTAIAWRAGGLLGFLLRGHGRAFAPPSEAAGHGLDAPFARLVLEPDAGAPVELLLSDLSLAKEAWLWNRRTNVLLRVDAETHRQLTPEPEDFTDPGRPNPWERWLQNLGPALRR